MAWCAGAVVALLAALLLDDRATCPQTCRRVRIKSSGAQRMLASAPLPAPAAKDDHK
jgi:hypothetical protein